MWIATAESERLNDLKEMRQRNSIGENVINTNQPFS